MGTDVRERYGIGKFRPPVRFSAGDSEPNPPLFQRYTEIENLRNFPDVFAPGEEVLVSEKIHGATASPPCRSSSAERSRSCGSPS